MSLPLAIIPPEASENPFVDKLVGGKTMKRENACPTMVKSSRLLSAEPVHTLDEAYTRAIVDDGESSASLGDSSSLGSTLVKIMSDGQLAHMGKAYGLNWDNNDTYDPIGII